MTRRSAPATFRQGDVLLTRVQRAPAGAKRMRASRGRLVLAEGEVTGHAHVIDAGAAQMLRSAEAVYVKILKASALTHEEHGAITLEPGTVWRVKRQREYVPKALPRQVAD
jgi:hypothetical protein